MTVILGRLLAAATSAVLFAGCAVARFEEPAVTAPPASAPTPIAPPPASSAAPGPSASPEPERPEGYRAAPGLTIESVWNFRDVAGEGDGLLLADGTRMAVGAVFRSGKLAPISKADRARLAKAGVTDIYDLRTPEVISRSPDPAIDGAEHHEVNIFAVHATPSAKPGSVAAAKEHMRQLNRNFVTDADQRAAIAVVLSSIAEDRGPVLVHCTEGKDRTGWISAMLQSVAGAGERTVIDEYLASNTYRKDLIEQDVAKARKSGGKQAAAIRRALVEVDASYLRAGLTEIKERYGDLEGYLTEGLGLSQDTIDTLRARLRAR